MVEREGCPIKEKSLPGVGAHDAGTSWWRHAEWALGGIGIGLHPVGLEFGGGLTPLLRYDFVKRSRSKAWLRASMK
jgi:hypothetical protein